MDGALMLWRRSLTAILLGASLAVALSLRPDAAESSPAANPLAGEQAGATRPASRVALGERGGFEAYLISYWSDGLLVHALMQIPETPRPASGYPVLIFNHGYHPDPPRYGKRVIDGVDDRPGDYYRGMPGAYAAQGYLVLTPDYRGHNASQGHSYTTSPLAVHYYARDVLHLLELVGDLPEADADRLFMAGHSMGGHVTALVASQRDRLLAASLWSPALAGSWEAAFQFDMKDRTEDGSERHKPRLATLREELARLELTADALDLQPRLGDLRVPLIVQHARRDPVVPYTRVSDFVAQLARHRKQYALYLYDSDEHLFDGADRARAIARDIKFFRRAEGSPEPGK